MIYTSGTPASDPDDPVFPPVYPDSMPLYWRNETSGILANAVLAYIGHAAGTGPAPSDDQARLLIAYCRYFIRAPVWQFNPEPLLHALQDAIDQATDLAALDQWLNACLDLGIDVL